MSTMIDSMGSPLWIELQLYKMKFVDMFCMSDIVMHLMQLLLSL
jgi:hypothetical protein